MSCIKCRPSCSHASLVEFANEYGCFRYNSSNIICNFSHENNIINVRLSSNEGCVVKLDFVPTRVERCMDTPRAATDGKIYALIGYGGIKYFDKLVELVENHDTEFTRLLLLEAKFEALVKQVYWMPGGPGYSMAKESYEEHANTSAKKE